MDGFLLEIMVVQPSKSAMLAMASAAALYSTRQPCFNNSVHSQRSSPAPDAQDRVNFHLNELTVVWVISSGTDRPNAALILKHSPWSYWMCCIAFEDFKVYLFITLSSISAAALNRLKQPGLQSTQPNTCSAVLCSQWPTAYSNFWYQTMGPAMETHNRHCLVRVDVWISNRVFRSSDCSRNPPSNIRRVNRSWVLWIRYRLRNQMWRVANTRPSHQQTA
ncbi:hypothetical protein EYF80_033078 [Liparis tanakae]|uniref:Uncharacterized protein n=1 Tax=Liparis tanakae TaxID=230148 RepID=A0A4Z2GVG5_9TELE|nr:hypothetical protein EYF80_033078 [Liparis tanakae]